MTVPGATINSPIWHSSMTITGTHHKCELACKLPVRFHLQLLILHAMHGMPRAGNTLAQAQYADAKVLWTIEAVKPKDQRNLTIGRGVCWGFTVPASVLLLCTNVLWHFSCGWGPST
jgi:hypothetical protein